MHCLRNSTIYYFSYLDIYILEIKIMSVHLVGEYSLTQTTLLKEMKVDYIGDLHRLTKAAN